MDENKLDSDRIVAEALALINEEGLDSLTMRRLASRLGIRAPTLYWYFEDKNALISEMLTVLFARILDQTPPADNWQDWMRGFGRSIWRAHDEYPQSAMLIISANVDEAHFQTIAGRITDFVGAFGLEQRNLVQLQSAVQSLMTGWSIFAHTQYRDRIETMIDFEEAALRSLDAMIAGWPDVR